VKLTWPYGGRVLILGRLDFFFLFFLKTELKRARDGLNGHMLPFLLTCVLYRVMSEVVESPKSNSEEEKKSAASSPKGDGPEEPAPPKEEVKRTLVEILAKGGNTFFCYEDDRAISECGLFAALQAGRNRIEQLDDVTDIVKQEGDESYGLMFIHRYPNGHTRLFVCSSSGGLFFTPTISLSRLQGLRGPERKRFVFQEGDNVVQLLKDSFDQAKAAISTDSKVESFGVDGKEGPKLSQESSGTILLNRSDALNFEKDIKLITGEANKFKGLVSTFRTDATKLSKKLDTQDSKIDDLDKKMADMRKSIDKLSGKVDKLQESVNSVLEAVATEDGESVVDETKSNTPRGGVKSKKHKGETPPQVIYCCNTCRSPLNECRCQRGQQYAPHGGYGAYVVHPSNPFYGHY
jgi:hypothetical protein